MKNIFIFLFISITSASAWSFPEMIRYGYTQCTACHVSPSGGGIQTQYGRQLSAEILSTWARPGEEQFLGSKWAGRLGDKGVLFGGDVRGIDVHAKDPTQDQNQAFLMMANLQGAYMTGQFTGVVSVGQIENPMDGGIHGNFNSTEYYGLLKFSDELGLRAGRFMPAFGLNLPDHTTAIKEMIGFVPEFQFDTVEVSYLNENWTILGAAGKTISSLDPSIQENAQTINASYSFLNSMRVGASYWSGQGAQVNRHIYGVNGIFGFTKRFYNMTELDSENLAGTKALYGLSQIAYEIYQGITPYLQYQHAHSDTSDSTTLTKTYGLGFHFYPRPHLEVSGEWDKVKTSQFWADSAYLLLHYYF